MKPEENLKKFNINLPNAPDPVGSYVASKIVGNFIYISGQVSFNNHGKLIKGKIGKELSLEQGQDAAKFCALNILAQLKKKCGSLDKIKKIVVFKKIVRNLEKNTTTRIFKHIIKIK